MSALTTTLNNKDKDSSKSPLVDVAMNYVIEVSKDLDNEAMEVLRDTFDSYIQRRKDYHECSYIVLQYLENASPLEKLDDILRLADVPAPPSPTLLLDSQSISPDCDINNTGKHFALANSGKTANTNRKKTRGWANGEDHRLLMGVHLYGLENWTLVAQFVGNGRTRSMCSQRWIRVLDPKISKNHWSEEEDKQLIQMVQLYGEKSWMKIATKLGNRSDVQCRYHFQQLQRAGTVSASSNNTTSVESPDTDHQKSLTNSTNLSQQQQQSSSPKMHTTNSTPIPAVQTTTATAATTTTTTTTGGSYHNATPFPELVLSEPTKQVQFYQQQQHYPIPQAIQQPIIQQIQQHLIEPDLQPVTEHELQLRLDEPFGLEESFDFWKSDPMFDNMFWAC